MRCNDLGDQMRSKQQLRFSGQLGPQAKLSAESATSNNAVLPAMQDALKKPTPNAKVGNRLDLNG